MLYHTPCYHAVPHPMFSCCWHTQGCIPELLSLILSPSSNAVPYLGRHWACAIDVLELVATLGSCHQPGIDGDVKDQRWVRKALQFVDSLSPSLAAVFDCADAAGSLKLRQAWGLTVRCERAIRAAAPRWDVLGADGRYDLADSICLSVTASLLRLVDQQPSAAWNAEDTAASLLQLLTSNAATMLKLARCTGQMDGTLLSASI